MCRLALIALIKCREFRLSSRAVAEAGRILHVTSMVRLARGGMLRCTIELKMEEKRTDEKPIANWLLYATVFNSIFTWILAGPSTTSTCTPWGVLGALRRGVGGCKSRCVHPGKYCATSYTT